MTDGALDSGLARERTSLAWTRTALALLGNGLLVLVRHDNAFPLAVSAALAGLSFVVALFVLTHALRSRIVAQHSHEIGSATRVIVPIGVAVTLLCIATAVALVWWH